MCLSLNSIVLEWPSRFHEPGVRFQVCPWNAAVQASRKTRIFTFSSLLSLSLPLLLSPFSTRETSYLNAPIGLHVSPFADEIRSRFDVLSSGPVTIHHRVHSTDLLSYAGVLFMTRTEIEDPLSLRPEIRFILQRRR